MAEAIQVSITAQDVFALKQSCQVIIAAYKRYVGSELASDENAIYPLMVEQIRGLRVDVEAGKTTLDNFDKLTLTDIERPKNDLNNLSNFKEIQNVEGNYTISQSVYDEAQAEVKKIFDGLKHREAPRADETSGANFNNNKDITKTQTKYPRNKYSAEVPKPKNEQVNSQQTRETNSQLINGQIQELAAAGAQTATYKSNPKGKFPNTLSEECIPCDIRLKNLDGLGPSADLLSILEDLKKRYEEIVNKLKGLLNNTDIAEDICSLLNFLDFQCLPDLYSIIILLSTLINKYRDAFLLNPDGAFMMFIGPFFSPLLNGLSELLDKYIQMIMRPIDCIVNSLDTQLAKLDIKRALDVTEIQNINFHRRREGYLRRKIEDLKERRAYLKGLVNNGIKEDAAPPQTIGGQPRSSRSNAVRDFLENNPGDSRAKQVKVPSNFTAVSIKEEIQNINEDLAKTQQEYDNQYGPNGENKLYDPTDPEGSLIGKSQRSLPALIGDSVGKSRGTLKSAREGINSSLYELRNQILNGRRMINDTLRVMKEELQRLIAGRAATSEEMIEGARNIQRLQRLIGVVNTLIKLANKGKLCENSNGDPSVALGSFLTANRGTVQNNNYYNVYIGENSSGDKSLLIAPSDAVLELADPETDEITQIGNLDEVNKLNRDGIPKDLGNIGDKKISATVTDLGFQPQISLIEFDLCKNSNLSTAPDVDKIKSWAINAGFSL